MRVPLRLSLILFLALPFCLFAQDAPDAPDAIGLSAPARVLPGGAATDSARLENANSRQPTTPVGLLPQYQGTRGFRPEIAKRLVADKSALRFILALPQRPLLIEASITINAAPFEMARERRIDRLIANLEGPVVEENQPEDTGVPARGAADTEGQGAEQPADAVDSEDSSEDDSEDGSEGDSEDSAEPEEPVVPLRELPSSALEARLRRYATVTGRVPSRDEVRWLLNKWVDGPTMLLLGENFQRFRATQTPVFNVLDRDLDGQISVEELQLAEQTLLSCDVNQNGVVEYTELAEVADDPRRAAPAQRHAPQLLPILDAAYVAKAYRRIGQRYDANEAQRFDSNGDGQLDESEIADLQRMEPDLTVACSFDRGDAAESTVRITQLRPQYSAAQEAAQIRSASITLPIDGVLLEFSAVQARAASDSDQISVGAINDGYPLLPKIDPNEDGRLTIRELRGVVKRLTSFDQDQDGGLSHGELPSTIRLSLGLGPSVHQHLADLRSVHPPAAVPDVPAPDWFVRMDRNQDGDISSREFPLEPKHFKRLDVDNDGLVSVSEAVLETKLSR